MELPAFDPTDFKKFTDGKTIVKVSAIECRLGKNHMVVCLSERLTLVASFIVFRILTWTS